MPLVESFFLMCYPYCVSLLSVITMHCSLGFYGWLGNFPFSLEVKLVAIWLDYTFSIRLWVANWSILAIICIIVSSCASTFYFCDRIKLSIINFKLDFCSWGGGCSGYEFRFISWNSGGVGLKFWLRLEMGLWLLHEKVGLFFQPWL